MDADAQAGRPLVAHVLVALADNDAQGIVPVPKRLGNGDDPASNLYWGARYGVRTYFPRSGWTAVRSEGPLPGDVLDRAVFRANLKRGRWPTTVWVVADAYRGPAIRRAIVQALDYSAGHAPVRVRIAGAEIAAGGEAHVVAYVGHDGLMDFRLPAPAPPPERAPARAVVVLACASAGYFRGVLEPGGAHPLLVTTDLMAPEAYSLEAALRSWTTGARTAAAREAAARAYDAYQHCGLAGARRLFAAGW